MTSLAEPRALLDAWEQAVHVPVPARAAVLVHRAGLVPTLDDALDLDVGACAALALRVHRESFGDRVDAVVACPRCGELLEAVLPAVLPAEFHATPSTLRPDGAGEPEPEPSQRPGGPERVVGTWAVRAPTTRDLLIAGRAPERAAEVLRARCVRPVYRDDASRVEDQDALRAAADLTLLSPDELGAIDAAAEELAGVGTLVSGVTCPGCGATAEVAFDAGAVLWEQIAAAVPGILADVAMLAGAFGWSEAEVLSLPAARRRAYLELVGQ